MFHVERYHDFSAGHRVVGHESKCAHFHGHNYRVYFVVTPVGHCTDEWHRRLPSGLPPEEPCPTCGSHFRGERAAVELLDDLGRVIDFGVIKDLLCGWLEDNWDHKMLLWQRDPQATALSELDPEGVVLVPFNPTAENMARYLVKAVAPRVLKGTGVILLTCRVEETRKCSATFTRDEL